MPFPLAHPAAVLPLRRFCPKRLNFPALLLGSVIPDASYLFATGRVEELAHRFIGSIALCLPVGLMILWLASRAHKLLMRLLPQQCEFILPPKEQLWPGASPFILALSLLLGVWSHLLCDGLTHRTGWFVLHIKSLQMPIGELLGRQVRVFHVIWYACTFLGVAWVVLAFENWRKQQPPRPLGDSSIKRWIVAIAVAALALLLALVHHLVHRWLALYFAGLLGCLFVGAATWVVQKWRRSTLQK